MAGGSMTGRRGRTLLPYGAVFVLAMAARVAAVLWRGGYSGYFDYDSGVYYAAASALVHGRLPYRDFVLVHPPGSMLVLSPFAALGDATTDQTGLVVANLFFSVLGSMAAVVVMLVIRELVPSRLAMWSGGLVYAGYPGAVGSEIEARLEPLANVLLLIGLLCLLRSARTRWWVAALGGAALTAAVSVKIWYVVPAAVVVVGYLAAGRRHRIGAVLAGVVVAALAIDGPFFVAAPRAMIRAVISDQVGRPHARGSVVLRLTQISRYRENVSPTMVEYREYLAAAVVTAVVLATIVAVSAIPRAGRLVAVMLAAQILVLLRSPTFYSFYVDYLSPAAAVATGVSVGVVAGAVRARLRSSSRSRTRAAAMVTLAGAAALSVVGAASTGGRATEPYPTADFAAAAATSRCVVSENPQALVQLDALSRGLAAGCPNWVDVQGRRLDVRRYHLGTRVTSPKWQHAFARYMLSGDAIATIAIPPAFVDRRLAGVLHSDLVLGRRGRLLIVRVTDEQRRQLGD